MGSGLMWPPCIPSDYLVKHRVIPHMVQNKKRPFLECFHICSHISNPAFLETQVSLEPWLHSIAKYSLFSLSTTKTARIFLKPCLNFLCTVSYGKVLSYGESAIKTYKIYFTHIRKIIHQQNGKQN